MLLLMLIQNIKNLISCNFTTEKSRVLGITTLVFGPQKRILFYKMLPVT